jgi:hypothetical protein
MKIRKPTLVFHPFSVFRREKSFVFFSLFQLSYFLGEDHLILELAHLLDLFSGLVKEDHQYDPERSK